MGLEVCPHPFLQLPETLAPLLPYITFEKALEKRPREVPALTYMVLEPVVWYWYLTLMLLHLCIEDVEGLSFVA